MILCDWNNPLLSEPFRAPELPNAPSPLLFSSAMFSKASAPSVEVFQLLDPLIRLLLVPTNLILLSEPPELSDSLEPIFLTESLLFPRFLFPESVVIA